MPYHATFSSTAETTIIMSYSIAQLPTFFSTQISPILDSNQSAADTSHITAYYSTFEPAIQSTIVAAIPTAHYATQHAAYETTFSTTLAAAI